MSNVPSQSQLSALSDNSEGHAQPIGNNVPGVGSNSPSPTPLVGTALGTTVEQGEEEYGGDFDEGEGEEEYGEVRCVDDATREHNTHIAHLPF